MNTFEVDALDVERDFEAKKRKISGKSSFSQFRRQTSVID
jgi:hypothetical protein